MPSEYLEDIDLPGHRGRPAMFVGDRVWLVDGRNRQTVKRLWDRLQTVTTITGGYGCLTTDDLDDVGVRETLISHWRTIDYTDAGERIEAIPGCMIAGDLFRLGLGLADIEQGTVVAPQRRPAPVKRHPAAEPAKAASSRHKGDRAAQASVAHEPVLIRRRSKGVTRGA
jgi:hypothetical protein